MPYSDIRSLLQRGAIIDKMILVGVAECDVPGFSGL
jgi:hypothetical protein